MAPERTEILYWIWVFLKHSVVNERFDSGGAGLGEQ